MSAMTSHACSICGFTATASDSCSYCAGYAAGFQDGHAARSVIRAPKPSPERRSEIAAKAARARWGKGART